MSRRVLAVVAALAAVLLVGGVAWAAIPHSVTGVITGCYKNSNPAKGAVIVIDAQAGESCPNGYTQLTWNKQHAHRAGISAHGQHTGPVAPNSAGVLQAQCPAGKTMFNDSWTIRDPDNFEIVGNSYSETFNAESRQLQWRAGPNGSQDPIGVELVIWCANNPDL